MALGLSIFQRWGSSHPVLDDLPIPKGKVRIRDNHKVYFEIVMAFNFALGFVNRKCLEEAVLKAQSQNSAIPSERFTPLLDWAERNERADIFRIPKPIRKKIFERVLAYFGSMRDILGLPDDLAMVPYCRTDSSEERRAAMIKLLYRCFCDDFFDVRPISIMQNILNKNYVDTVLSNYHCIHFNKMSRDEGDQIYDTIRRIFDLSAAEFPQPPVLKKLKSRNLHKSDSLR
jgi:hypothetical protein